MQKELEEFQNNMAMNDLLHKPSRTKLAEILLKQMQPLHFRTERDRNHSNPYLHITYSKQQHAASYGINGGQSIAEKLPNRYDKDVEHWIDYNRPALLHIWDVIKSGNQRKYETLIGQL